MSAKRVIQKLGGVRAAARKLALARSTVGTWNATDRIPAKWQPVILSWARRHGIGITPEDFFFDCEDDANALGTSIAAVTPSSIPTDRCETLNPVTEASA